MLNLSKSDLRFLVESVATSRRDYDHIVNLIRDKEDLLEPMLEAETSGAALSRSKNLRAHLSAPAAGKVWVSEATLISRKMPNQPIKSPAQRNRQFSDSTPT
jgi:hypothetical protein